MNFSRKCHHLDKNIFATDYQNNKVLNTSFDVVLFALLYETVIEFTHLTDSANRPYILVLCFLRQIDRMEKSFSDIRYYQYYQTIAHLLYYWWWKMFCYSSYFSWENENLLKIVSLQKSDPLLLRLHIYLQNESSVWAKIFRFFLTLLGLPSIKIWLK